MKYLVKHCSKKTAHCSAHLARIFDALNVHACVVDMRATGKLLSSQETHAGHSHSRLCLLAHVFTNSRFCSNIFSPTRPPLSIVQSDAFDAETHTLLAIQHDA